MLSSGAITPKIAGAITPKGDRQRAERVKAGLNRAKAKGTKLGRPRLAPEIEAAIRADLDAGKGIISTAKAHGVGTAAVQRIKAEALG